MTGQLVGYARVSTTDQDLSIQMEQLTAVGCEQIFAEKRSGTTVDKREELARCLEYVRAGDTLIVAKVDRLGRSLVDLAKIVDGLQKKGVKFRALDQNFDVETPGGKAMMQMLMVFAELENSFRRQRQMEGIAAAKARGVYDNNRRTRQMRSRQAYARQLLEKGLTYAEAAEKSGLHRFTLYKKYPEYKKQFLTPEERKARTEARDRRRQERIAKAAANTPAPAPEEVIPAPAEPANEGGKPGFLGKLFSGVKR